MCATTKETLPVTLDLCFWFIFIFLFPPRVWAGGRGRREKETDKLEASKSAAALWHGVERSVHAAGSSASGEQLVPAAREEEATEKRCNATRSDSLKAEFIICTVCHTQLMVVPLVFFVFSPSCLEAAPAKDAAVEQLQKQIDNIVQELNLLKEQQALQTGEFPSQCPPPQTLQPNILTSKPKPVEALKMNKDMDTIEHSNLGCFV